MLLSIATPHNNIDNTDNTIACRGRVQIAVSRPNSLQIYKGRYSEDAQPNAVSVPIILAYFL